MDVKYEKATIEDAMTLIDIRNQCFYEDYIRYGECPGYNISREHMINSIQNRIAYKIICNNQVVGNISIQDHHDNTYYIHCICVIPEYENKGIGQSAMKFIENEFPNATLWTLRTPSDKERNLYFYNKVGYTIVDECIKGSVKLVVFEKKVNSVI